MAEEKSIELQVEQTNGRPLAGGPVLHVDFIEAEPGSTFQYGQAF